METEGTISPKFTLGPWGYAPAGDNLEISNTIDPVATGGTIAYVPCTHPNAEANARLIAAAVDLLVACKAVVAEWDSLQYWWEEDDDTPNDMYEAVNLAQFVIAKAEGGAS